MDHDELEERARLLAAENEMLAERAEDSLLLGLIGEKIGLCDDAAELPGLALEQVAVLKDLAVSLRCEIEGNEVLVTAGYALYSAVEMRGWRLPLSGELARAEETGEILQFREGEPGSFSRSLLAALGLPLRAFICVPFRNRRGRAGFYLFADETGNPRLENLFSMLRRTVDLLLAREDNLCLLGELRALNESLDRQVESRTAQLLAANKALIREVEERRLAEELLRKALEEKTVLLREIHHRVKNNLQVISSLLSLQAGEAGDERFSGLIRTSQERVRAMALVHEGLYQSESLSSIEFGAYLRGLLGSGGQSSSGARVELAVDAEEVELDLETAIPCALVVNELVANSLKHAFADRAAGRVEVRVRGSADGVEISVADDGRGMPPELSLDKVDSMGLTLVRMLVQQLHGSFRAEPGPGTRLTLRLPAGGRAAPPGFKPPA